MSLEIKNKKMEAKKVSDSTTIMTQLVMPNDTNPLGNLMGGNLLYWMDIAGGVCAGKHAEKNTVTASVDHVSFRKPIMVGDVITIHASVTRAFTTSVEVYVEVYASDIKGKNNRLCNNAYYTFVALDDETRKPTTMFPVLPLSSEEQERYESAVRRREVRLILSKRMKPENAKHLKEFFGSMKD